MALGNRNEETDRHRVTDNTKLTRMSASFAEAKHLELEAFPMERGMLYQIQKMNDDIKEIHRYLGSEVTTNTATNLSTAVNATTVRVASSDGTNADISSATGTAAGILTAANFQNLATASLACSSEGTYFAISKYTVWIPGTRFYGPNAVYAEGVAKTSNTSTVLMYDFAGIDTKKVTHVIAYTSATNTSGLTVKQWRGTHGASLATLANRQSTNSNINITDWTCAAGEQLHISVYPRSTTIELYGVALTLTDA